MRRIKWLLASIVVTSLTAFGSTTSASAAAPVVLKEAGLVAPEGSPASGSLELTCAQIFFGGALTVNDKATDKAVFSEGGGTDLCEGVVVRGVVKAIKVTSGGNFVVVSHLSYEVLTGRTCVYVIGKLTGRFTIPGNTTSTVSGTARLAAKRSAPGCAEQMTIGGAHAALSSGTTHEPYLAEK